MVNSLKKFQFTQQKNIVLLFWKNATKLSVVVHTYKPITQEAEVENSQVQDQPVQIRNLWRLYLKKLKRLGI